jgi:uncharacterized protein
VGWRPPSHPKGTLGGSPLTNATGAAIMGWPVDEPPFEQDEPRPEAAPAPPRPPRKSALTFFAVVLVLYASLGMLAQASSQLLGFAWSEIFTLLVPALVAATGSNLRVSRVLGLERAPGPSALVLALLIGAVSSFAADALMALESLLLPARWVAEFDLTRFFESGSLLFRLSLAAGAALLAPFCEEVAFRGYILTSLRTRYSPRVAILGSAVLFALMHLDPVRLLALVALGGVYGWLSFRAGSVWPSILAHAVNNALGVALLVTGGRSPSPPSGSGAALAGPSTLILLVALAALAPLLSLYRGATASPPPFPGLLERARPEDPATDFRAERVPLVLRATVMVGAVSLALLLARRF